MVELTFKQRTFHVLPGRLRTEMFGLLNNSDRSSQFERVLSSFDGITQVKASAITGKILILFKEEIMSLEEICQFVKRFEEISWKEDANLQQPIASSKEICNDDVLEEVENIYLETAASVEHAGSISNHYFHNNDQTVSSYLNMVPVNQNARSPDGEKVPFPLKLAVGGLSLLGIKQLILGKSALARSMIPFYLSGFVAICTGYPFIKRGLKRLEKKRKINMDLLLGASSLALALIRENIVVLAGISLLQFLNWKSRNSVEVDVLNEAHVSPQIETYSRRASRLGILGAIGAFAVTRNPIASLAVLLAVNPRPATVSTEYTWKQAELIVHENGHSVPKNGSVFQLAQTKAVVVEDASLLIKNERISNEFVQILNSIRGGQLVLLGNEKRVDINELNNVLMNECNVQLSDFSVVHSYGREEILFVAKDDSALHSNVNSFYPTVSIKDLPDMTVTMSKAKQLAGIVKRNVFVTKIWNLLGGIIAVPLIVSAPIINVIADSLLLSFMSRSKRWTEKHFGKTGSANRGREITQTNWHSIKKEEILNHFHVDAQQGLHETQVQTAFKTYGKNELQTKAQPSWIVSYLGQFKEFTTIILGATALFSVLTGHLFDGIAMGSILLLNSAIGTYQERKAEKAVETLSQFVPPNCKVIRNGNLIEVAATDLVPGDVVEVELGDIVPADLRLINGWNLEVNESALTGESLPVGKKENQLDEICSLSDRTNMLYMGTHITRGKGRAVVVHTGQHTEMGYLLSLLTEEKKEMTPLQKQVTSISKAFMKFALLSGILVFAAGLIRGVPITQMVTTSIALAASAIPEGLPITITIALTAGIFRMAKKKAIVRNLSALETLGRTTVICSDKTGTLTTNEMTIKKIATIEKEYNVSGNGYTPVGKITDSLGNETECKELNQLLSVGLLCSNTELTQISENKWSIKGDPTEGAIVSLAAKRNVWLKKLTNWKRMHEIPFDSSKGMMSIVCKDENQQEQCYVMSKGSVEKILSQSTHYQRDGKVYEMTEEVRGKILQQTEQYANDALRVLGFAYYPIENKDCFEDIEDLEESLIYLGLVGMMDPPKPDVEQSIVDALELGIKPVMITGDHPKTALAIAKQVGICDGSSKIMTGQELDGLSNEELEEIINDIAIYARVTPEHKLRIVSVLQKKGHIVAMTGDGVNDSPAIKKANIGIAMGQTGTQVTKETADMILKEDHFGSIVDGVKEGRTIIGNIRKALGCLLSGNLAEILVTSAAVIAGLPLPIIPVQILLMNLLTDALPATILAVNPGNKSKNTEQQGIVDKKLYKQVATRGVLLGAGSLALFIASLAAGASLAVAQTTAFATLVAGQLIQTFSWRQAGSDESIKDWSKDRFLVGALGVSWLSLLAVTYIGPLGAIFKTAPLPLFSWLPILAVASSSAILAKPLVRMITKPERQQSISELETLAVA